MGLAGLSSQLQAKKKTGEGKGEGEDPPLQLIFLVINTRHSVTKVPLIGLGGTDPKSRPKQLREGARGGSHARMGKAR